MMREFTYAEVEAILIETFGISLAKRIAFSGRLKAMIKHRVPLQKRAGRGVAASFTADHLLQLALAMELTCSGLTPKTAAGLIRRTWHGQAEGILSAIRVFAESFPDSTTAPIKISVGWIWVAYVNEFSDLQRFKTRSFGALQQLAVRDFEKFSVSSHFTKSDDARAVLVNPAVFFLRVFGSIDDVLGPVATLDHWLSYYENWFEGIVQASELFTLGLADDGQSESEWTNPEIKAKAIAYAAELPFGYAKARLLTYALTREAAYELVWIASDPDLWRDEAIVPGRLDARKKGQEELRQLGMLKGDGEPFTPTPHLTQLGECMIDHFIMKEDGDVDPQA